MFQPHSSLRHVFCAGYSGNIYEWYPFIILITQHDAAGIALLFSTIILAEFVYIGAFTSIIMTFHFVTMCGRVFVH